MTKLLHPLAPHNSKTIDVFYGGNERDAIAESAKLAYDCVKYLPTGQHALYINTLVDHETLERTMNKYVSRRPRLLFCTWLEKSFMERLTFLEHAIQTKDVAVLVINSFDWAALTQRHRVLLSQWLRRVRNLFKLRIVIFMQCMPGYYGVNGSLRFIANNLVEVGSYKKELAGEMGSLRIEQEEAIAEEFRLENETLEAVESTEPEDNEATPVISVPLVPSVLLVPSTNEDPNHENTNDETADNDTVDEEATWISESTEEELADLVRFFGGDFTSDAAKWVLEEVERRKLPVDVAQWRSLKNKELEVVDVM